MLRRLICLVAALAFCLSACGQPERVGVAPQPIIDTTEEAEQTSSTDSEPMATSTTPEESTSRAEAGTSSSRVAPPPASPESATATAGPGECLPQYTVVAETYARDGRAGDLVGRVHPGAQVGVKQSDGVWAYGYVSAIDGRGAGWAWMLHEKMRRISGPCS